MLMAACRKPLHAFERRHPVSCSPTLNTSFLQLHVQDELLPPLAKAGVTARAEELRSPETFESAAWILNCIRLIPLAELEQGRDHAACLPDLPPPRPTHPSTNYSCFGVCAEAPCTPGHNWTFPCRGCRDWHVELALRIWIYGARGCVESRVCGVNCLLLEGRVEGSVSGSADKD